MTLFATLVLTPMQPHYTHIDSLLNREWVPFIILGARARRSLQGFTVCPSATKLLSIVGLQDMAKKCSVQIEKMVL